jgi:SAM-dependent methyltransferase
MDKPLNLAALVASDRRPEPWEEGSQKMWTDPYIREHIVYAHLEPHEDDGSKPFDQIQAEVEHWVRTFGGTGRVLDLGCGPGIYLREMALRGWKGIGLDFNQSAILYAQDLNRDEGLSLEYRWGDFLTLDWPKPMDLITLVYGTFGVLSPCRGRLW